MSEETRIPEKVTSTPYEDHEYPNIRFDIKENEDSEECILIERHAPWSAHADPFRSSSTPNRMPSIQLIATIEIV